MKVELEKLKCIYFDVGGVLVKDFSKTDKWNRLMENIGILEKDTQVFTELFDKFEPSICNRENIETFTTEFERLTGFKFPNYLDLVQEFVDLFEPNFELVEFATKLQTRYKIGLLTNMYPGMLEKIKGKGYFKSFEADIVVDSSIEKVSKPDKEIFEIAERKSGFSGAEILFIDNTQKHLDAAKTFGWQTLYFDSGDYEGSNLVISEILS